MPATDKQSYAKGFLLVYQAFQLALKFVAVDTEATPKSPTAHTANRYRQPNHDTITKQNIQNETDNFYSSIYHITTDSFCTKTDCE
jgi:hypothetical protein